MSSVRKEHRASQAKLAATLPHPPAMYRLPHKKRASIRMLSKQNTLLLTESTTEKQEIRKKLPPKKQTTIRRNARNISLARQLLKQSFARKQNALCAAAAGRSLSYSLRPSVHTVYGTVQSTSLYRQNTKKLQDEATEVEPELEAINNKDIAEQYTDGLSMPTLATQTTLPVAQNNDKHIALEIKVTRQCRSYSQSNLPQTVVKRNKKCKK